MESLNEKIPPITDYRLTKVTCQRCLVEWFPHVKTRPKKCPYCQCSKWDDYKPKKGQEVVPLPLLEESNQPSLTKEALKG